MEIITILFIFLLAFVFLKILGLVFHAGIFMLALPFKLLALFVSALFVLLIMVPLGIVAAIGSVLLIPFAIIPPLIPYILVGIGLYYLLKKRN